MVVLSELTSKSMKFLNPVFLEAVYMLIELYLHFFFYKIYSIYKDMWKLCCQYRNCGFLNFQRIWSGTQEYGSRYCKTSFIAFSSNIWYLNICQTTLRYKYMNEIVSQTF